MSKQKVNVVVNSATVTLTSAARWLRTVIHVVLGLALAVPTILNTPAVSGNAVLAKDLGIAGGYIVGVAAVINTLENLGIIPVSFAKAIDPSAVVPKTIPVPEALPPQ